MSWDLDTKRKVWANGTKVGSNDPNNFRKDRCGAWIQWSEYDNRDSPTNFGWEIDHIDPNGGDALTNLQPLQWKNNVDKSDGRLKCNVTSSGTKNVEQ